MTQAEIKQERKQFEEWKKKRLGGGLTDFPTLEFEYGWEVWLARAELAEKQVKALKRCRTELGYLIEAPEVGITAETHAAWKEARQALGEQP